MDEEMHKPCSERLQENTVDTVFQNMDDFYLPNEYDKFTMSLKLAFPKFSKGFTASDFDQFIEKIVGVSNVVSLGRLSFPNEWQMQVSCPETREKLIRDYSKVKINGRSCTISPLSQSEVRGFVNWMPSQIPNSELKEVLRTFGEVLFIENVKLKLKMRGFDDSGKAVYEKDVKQKKETERITDSRYFGLYLRSGQTVEDIPYFITLCGNRCFVSIPGRSPLCFHCKVVGHLKKECKIYAQKLSSYCNRKPTGVRRKKPRGRRHKALHLINSKQVCADKGKVTTLQASLSKLDFSSDVQQGTNTKISPKTELSEEKPVQLCEENPKKLHEENLVQLHEEKPEKSHEENPQKLQEEKLDPVDVTENNGSVTENQSVNSVDSPAFTTCADLIISKPTGAKSKKKKKGKKKKQNSGIPQ